jgi:hypothetical protein
MVVTLSIDIVSPKRPSKRIGAGEYLLLAYSPIFKVRYA